MNATIANVRVWLGRWGMIGLLVLGGCMLLIADFPQVVLTWETASEVGTAGFNIYRAETDAGPFTPVNTALIPAQGDETTGAAYRFEDDHLVPIRRYVYRIEEIEMDGDKTLYPETVAVNAGLPQAWTKGEGVFLLLLGGWFAWQKRRLQ